MLGGVRTPPATRNVPIGTLNRSAERLTGFFFSPLATIGETPSRTAGKPLVTTGICPNRHKGITLLDCHHEK